MMTGEKDKCPYLSEEYCPDCADREDCQVYAGTGEKKLDRPDRAKLREKIANAISECDFESVGCDGLAQHILNRVPIEPLIEEADHKRLKVKRKELFPYGHKDCYECENFVTGQEGERIRGLLDLCYTKDRKESFRMFEEIRQALKGEKEETHDRKDLSGDEVLG